MTCRVVLELTDNGTSRAEIALVLEALRLAAAIRAARTPTSAVDEASRPGDVDAIHTIHDRLDTLASTLRPRPKRRRGEPPMHQLDAIDPPSPMGDVWTARCTCGAIFTRERQHQALDDWHAHADDEAAA